VGLAAIAADLRALVVAVIELRGEVRELQAVVQERAGKHEAGLADLEAALRSSGTQAAAVNDSPDRSTPAGMRTRARTYEASDDRPRSGSGSSSTSQRGTGTLSATHGDRRASHEELRIALEAAPRNYDEPTPAERDAFLTAWTKITEQPVRASMIGSLARICRVHGPQVADVLKRRYAITGTTENLILVMLREEEPEPTDTRAAGGRASSEPHNRRTAGQHSKPPTPKDIGAKWTRDEIPDARPDPPSDPLGDQR